MKFALETSKIQNTTTLASLAETRRKMNNVIVRCKAGCRRKEAISSSLKGGELKPDIKCGPLE
jgi:hypothetical protein